MKDFLLAMGSRIFSAVFHTDRVIGFIAGLAILAGSAAANMQPEEVKAIICASK